MDDHNRGVDLILEKGVPGAIYNIGGNNEWTNMDIVTLICELIKEHFDKDKDRPKSFLPLQQLVAPIQTP